MKNIFTFVCAALFSCYAFAAFADETNEQMNNEGTETVANVESMSQESGEST